MNTSFTSIATFKKFYNILIHWPFYTKLESLCSHRFWVGSKSPFGKLKGENQMFGSIYGAVYEWQRKKSLLWYVVISTLKFNSVFKVTASWAMHSFRMEISAIYRQTVSRFDFHQQFLTVSSFEQVWTEFKWSKSGKYHDLKSSYSINQLCHPSQVFGVFIQHSLLINNLVQQNIKFY